MTNAERETAASPARSADARSPFVRLAELLGDLKPGKPAINLSVGEPQHPIPSFVGPVLAAHLPRFGRYPLGKGTEPFRRAAVDWLGRRYGLMQGATSLKADLTVPAGTLDLAGGSEHAVETDFEYSAAWSRPRLDYHVSSGVAELEIAQDNRGPALGPNDDNWRLRFNKSVPLDIRLKMGVGEGDLRFRDANLQKLFIEVGVGKVDIDLTGERKGDVNVGIHGGIGQAVIHLPKNVGVVVEAKKGIGAVTTEGLKSQDGNYVNDAYGKSPHTIHVFAEAGIGNIDLTVEP